MQNQKFVYPVSSPYQVVIKSKRIGYIGRRFQRDMPIELRPYISEERYQKTIRYLENVSKYTYIGQVISFLPSIIIGVVMVGVGETKKTETTTPIYWYIGIIILGISFIYIFIALATFRSKYIKNLAYAVQKCHTEYNNEFGISWTLKYVDFRNRKNKNRQKLWCELTIPNNATLQQPIPHPNAYPNQNDQQQQQQQQTQYIPMNYYYSTQPQQQYVYPGTGLQLGNGNNGQQPQNINQPYYSYPNSNSVVIPIDNQPSDDAKPVQLSKNI
ncbi:hypothetical protein DICPUDRAFT_151610 [Dictyostelium purpureum]|uniref:Transmembrane protein n=1 Tax=Dictyostelium purpureum TaxID=5786 RepID=F0ZJA1_DICPU|nr:uncharacterized protein DICPUDRAFT_151610 [Dictyostelium purpureum]EGC36000.1 hypothetical protein DICPUDRAFT_151610 [Dictyostelium purpureum]|eukprot:XP_003287501.1 hypothetical protein DICPUDRAFT_151610 [Dictyostelium purpureum]